MPITYHVKEDYLYKLGSNEGEKEGKIEGKDRKEEGKIEGL